MTLTQGLRLTVCAAAIVLAASFASAQTGAASHGPGIRPHAAPAVDVAARRASLDARIAVLRADMMMLVGELKIQAMASLLDALVERQALADEEMRRLRETMRDPINDDESRPPAADLEPETLCSPYI